MCKWILMAALMTNPSGTDEIIDWFFPFRSLIGQVSQEEFDKKLARHEKWYNELFSIKRYRDIRFKDDINKKTLSLKQISEIKRKVFFLMELEKLELSLAKFDEQLKAEIVNTENNIEAKGEKYLASIKKCHEDMRKLWNRVAVRHEQFLDEIFEEHPGVFTPSEQEFLRRQLMERHNEDEIIERKK